MPKGRRNAYDKKVHEPGPDDKFYLDLPPLEGTPACTEADPSRFDSMNHHVHAQVAIDFCFGCNARKSCLLRRKLLAEKLPARCGPEGTWGGLLFNTYGERVLVPRRAYNRYYKQIA